jgi:hypothetical protein
MARLCGGERFRRWPFVIQTKQVPASKEERRNVMHGDEITIIILAIANAALCYVIFHLA